MTHRIILRKKSFFHYTIGHIQNISLHSIFSITYSCEIWAFYEAPSKARKGFNP